MFGPDDDPTTEQSVFIWKQALEDAWVKAKCQSLDSTLDFTELHLGLYESMKPPRLPRTLWRNDTEMLLVELAARLGDDAAGLTQRLGNKPPGGGYKYGRFAELIKSEEWHSLILTGATRRVYIPQTRREPDTKQFLSIFNMLAQADSPAVSPHGEIQFNWQAVVKHLCAPTHLRPADAEAMGVQPSEIQSCKEIVSEIRDIGVYPPPVLAAMDKFERVAMELDLYD